MAWQDRPYYRDDRGGLSANPILRALNGSVPLFTAFGIRVRAHASLIALIICVLLFDYSKGHSLLNRAIMMAALAVVIILHEFGHCFAARSVGGSAENILLWPLGGLAFAEPPHRPWPTFWTVAGGPLVNVVICVICAGSLFAFLHVPVQWAILNPIHGIPFRGYSDPAFYFWCLYATSYILLLFNLLPMFPLDGGQMLQSALWPRVGYFRSMNIATITGMVGGVALAILGIFIMQLGVAFIGGWGVYICYQRRRMLQEMGQEEWGYSDSGIDYASSIYAREEQTPKRKRLSRRAIAQARRIAQREAGERDRIDSILAKVSAHGVASLTWSERRSLRKATERQRQRDVELAKYK